MKLKKFLKKLMKLTKIVSALWTKQKYQGMIRELFTIFSFLTFLDLAVLSRNKNRQILLN